MLMSPKAQALSLNWFSAKPTEQLVPGNLDRDRVTGGPAGADLRAARNLEVARQGGVLVTHVEVLSRGRRPTKIQA